VGVEGQGARIVEQGRVVLVTQVEAVPGQEPGCGRFRRGLAHPRRVLQAAEEFLALVGGLGQVEGANGGFAPPVVGRRGHEPHGRQQGRRQE